MTTILYIDDERDLAGLYAELLREKGYNVWLAGSGEEGLEVLETKGLPNLILVDFQMPSMTGEQFMSSALERFPEVSKVRSVGFTGYRADHPSVGKFKSLVTTLIQKPHDIDEFFALLRTILK